MHAIENTRKGKKKGPLFRSMLKSAKARPKSFPKNKEEVGKEKKAIIAKIKKEIKKTIKAIIKAIKKSFKKKVKAALKGEELDEEDPFEEFPFLKRIQTSIMVLAGRFDDSNAKACDLAARSKCWNAQVEQTQKVTGKSVSVAWMLCPGLGGALGKLTDYMNEFSGGLECSDDAITEQSGNSEEGPRDEGGDDGEGEEG